MNIYYIILNFFKIYFWLFWVFIATCELSPGAVSSGCSLVEMGGLLTVVVSAVAHRAQALEYGH